MKTMTSMFALIGLQAAVAVAAPDIDVSKSVNNGSPMANEPVEFTVRAGNIGDEAAINVVIVDRLPEEMALPVGTAAFPSTGTYDPDTGEWLIGDLAAGIEAVLTIPAIVTDASPPDCIVNLALSSFVDITDDSNDEARAAIYQPGVERCVDLDIRFGISSNPPIIPFPTCNSEERYDGDVEVINFGPDAARDVVVTISQNPVFGPNLRFDDVDCSNSPASQCQIAEIAAGATVTIDVTSDLYQSYSMFSQTISVSSTTSDVDYNVANNNPSVTGSGGGFSDCTEIDFGIPAPPIGPDCFIATAAYGSPLDPHLDSLRNFRDRFLMTNAPGRVLVGLYYRHSPPIADFIADRNWLRAVVRGLLGPIIIAIEYPRLSAIIFAGSLASWFALRRRRRVAIEAANFPLTE